MNILLSSISGHDKTESSHVRRVLERLGHRVLWVSDPSRGGSSVPGLFVSPGFALGTSLDDLFAAVGREWDLFLYVEPLGFIPEGIERAGIPTAALICDVHNDLRSRRRLARFFDHVFLYHRNYLKAFDEHPPANVHWHPYACDVELFRPLGVARDLDVAWVGQLFEPGHERGRVLAGIRERWRVNEQRWYFQHEIPGVYSRAKIVVNLPLSDDLNFRVFEAMSCGALLLTRRIANGQELLFEEGRHYIAFADEQELHAKIEYYLAHEDLRAQIAEAGHAEILRAHHLELRITSLLQTVLAAPAPAAPVRRMTPEAVDMEYAWLYEYWKSLDAGARLVRAARTSGRPWVPLLPPVLRTLVRATVR
jgi:hypothetical protein